MGKAGDVVKIKLRNNALIDHTENLHVIFDILKQNFSELTYSNMPLAEFYNTLPMQFAVKPLKPSTVMCKAHSQCHVPMADDATVMNTAVSPLQPPVPPAHADVDSDCMRSLVNLLDRLVTQQTQVPVNLNTQPIVPQSPRQPCRVCGKSEHSTVLHCRQENRCLKCLSPGHWKRDCPQHLNQRHSQVDSSAVGLNQQLN